MRFWKREGDAELEARLRAGRPEPRPEVTRTITDRVRPRHGGSQRGLRRAPLGLAGGLTAFVLTAAIVLGGWSAPTDAAHRFFNFPSAQQTQVVAAAPTANQYDTDVTVCVLGFFEMRLSPLAAQTMISFGLAQPGPCGAVMQNSTRRR